MPENDDDKKPLIPASYAPLVAAGVSLLTTLVVWSMSQVINLNQRIDKLEAVNESLLDEQGRPVPSQTAIRSEVRLDALDKKMDEVYKNLDRLWDVLNRMQGL